MTTQLLSDKLRHANDEVKKGNNDTADYLALEILAALPQADGVENELLTLRCSALHVLAMVAKDRGALQQAIEYELQALAIAEKYNLLDVQPNSYNLLGIVAKSAGDYDKALEWYAQALHAHTIRGDKKNMGAVIVNIGNVYNQIGSYDKALEYLQRAIAVFEEIGEEYFMANATMSIGIVYYELGNYPKALDYYHRALHQHEAIGTKSTVADIIGNIGSVYFSIGEYNSALEYFVRALSSHRALGALSKAARYTGNAGAAYYSLGEYDKAYDYYIEALDVLEKQGIKSSMALVLASMGNLYANQNYSGYNSAYAKDCFLRSIAISEEIGAKHDLYTTYKSLADVLKAEKNWEEFAEYFQKFYNTEKEVQSEEAQHQAEQLEYRRKIEESERDRQVKLARFQEQEKILHNILPAQIADRMIEGEKTIADSHEHVSVFFSDIVGFTKLSQRVSAEELVGMLNGIFTQFDQLARKHGLEKIKTIGDAYMAVCGAPIRVDNHAERTALFALDVAELMNNYQTNTGDKVMIRIGLHSGSVVAGIIGENKFAYDMWGDAVNTASRMESHGEAGKIHVSEEFKQELQKGPGLSQEPTMSFHFQERGEIDIKGKGIMKTYFLEKA